MSYQYIVVCYREPYLLDLILKKFTQYTSYQLLIQAQHKPKHKLEKWFIISDDGVRTYTYIRTYI